MTSPELARHHIPGSGRSGGAVAVSTAHQWTPGNALSGVMLIVGLLRELECWAVEEDEDQPARS